VKVGFAGITSASRIEALIRAAVRGVTIIRLKPDPTPHGTWGPPSGGPIWLKDAAGVVAVAYADAEPVAAFVDIAARAGATGVLLDTAEKAGPGLRGLIAPAALARWVSAAHDAGLLVAMAGKLTADDLAFVRDAGADIAGVRGAACEGGRTGRVSADKVARLRQVANYPREGVASADSSAPI
jgi:hypothetical protein